MAFRRGTAGDDNLTGTDQSDIIFGLAGNDTVEALEGNDFIDAGSGNDEAGGGLGADIVFGRQGDDELNAGEGTDYVDGGPGADELSGGSDNDVLRDGSGGDRIEGRAGEDTLFLSNDSITDNIRFRADESGVDTIFCFDTSPPGAEQGQSGGDRLDLQRLEIEEDQVVLERNGVGTEVSVISDEGDAVALAVLVGVCPDDLALGSTILI